MMLTRCVRGVRPENSHLSFYARQNWLESRLSSGALCLHLSILDDNVVGNKRTRERNT